MVSLRTPQGKWDTDIRGDLEQHDTQPENRDTSICLILGHARVFEEARRQDTRDVGTINSHPCEHDLEKSMSEEHFESVLLDIPRKVA